MEIGEGILHNKNFLRLWTSQVLSQIALHSVNFILVISAYSIAGTNKAVAFVIISSGLAAFLFGVPAGVLSDHLNRKSTLFWTSILRFMIVLALISVDGNLFGILVLVFILGSVTQFFFPSEAASIPVLVKKDNLVSANSLFSITYYLAQVIGYILSGFLLMTLGYDKSIFVVATPFFLATFFIRSIIYPSNDRNNLSNRHKAKQLLVLLKNDFTKTLSVMKNEFTKGFKLIKSKKNIQKSFIYLVGLQMSIGIVASLVPGFAVEVVNVRAENASMLLVAPVAFGLFVGSVFLSKYKDRINRSLVIHIAIFFAFIGFLSAFSVPYLSTLFVTLYKYIFVLISMFLIGLANAFVFVISNTRLQELVEEQMLGRIYGLLQTTATISAGIPVLLSSIFADIVGVHYIFLILGVSIVLMHLFIMTFFHSQKV